MVCSVEFRATGAADGAAVDVWAVFDVVACSVGMGSNIAGAGDAVGAG